MVDKKLQASVLTHCASQPLARIYWGSDGTDALIHYSVLGEPETLTQFWIGNDEIHSRTTLIESWTYRRTA